MAGDEVEHTLRALRRPELGYLKVGVFCSEATQRRLDPIDFYKLDQIPEGAL